MTIEEILNKIDELDQKATIYAEAKPKWTCSSLAVVALEPPDNSLPPEAAGMEYFLEVAISKEVLEVWQQWRQRIPSTDEKCAAVIYYAENDAYIDF